MSATRLQRVLHRILKTPFTTGLGVVSAIVRPGEIRLSGLEARVLVAGSSVPQVGEQIAYVVCPSRGVKVASHNLPQVPHFIPSSPAKQYEQVLVGSGEYLLAPDFAHVDPTGRFWLMANGFYFSQEPDAFAETPWTFRGRGGGMNPRFSCLSGQEAVLEYSTIDAKARLVHINTETGELSFDSLVQPFFHDSGDLVSDWRGLGREPGGHFVLGGAGGPFEGGPPGCWGELYAFSDKVDSPDSWTWEVVEWHPTQPVLYPLFLSVGNSLVVFRYRWRSVDGVITAALKYRVYSGGSWGPLQETGFTLGQYTESISVVASGENEVHLIFPDGSNNPDGEDAPLMYVKGELSGNSISFGIPVKLFDHSYGASAMQRNYLDGAASVALWAQVRSHTAQYEPSFQRWGAPPNEEPEETIDCLEDQSFWSGLRGGSGIDGERPQDGFVAFNSRRSVLDPVRGYVTTYDLYAGRIVEG